VGDYHNRHSLFVEFGKKAQHRFAVRYVQVPGGLVTQDDVGRPYECAGDRGPLLLTTGECCGLRLGTS